MTGTDSTSRSDAAVVVDMVIAVDLVHLGFDSNECHELACESQVDS